MKQNYFLNSIKKNILFFFITFTIFSNEAKGMHHSGEAVLDENTIHKKQPNIKIGPDTSGKENDLQSEEYEDVLVRKRLEGEKKGLTKAARRMLAKKYTVDKIIEMTGLSAEEIEALKSNPDH